MHELLVLRHAKSAWDNPGLADHDRPLAPRGIAAAGRMGALIAERGWLPDRILCSTAKRTQETLRLASAEWPEATAIPTFLEEGLYLAAPQQLLACLRRQPENARRLMVIGHNPGLQSFVLRLAGAGDKHLLAAIERKLPTAALVRLLVDLPSWQAVGWGEARLADYERPGRKAA